MPASEEDLKTVEDLLFKICVEIPNRAVGSDGNRAATQFFADILSSYGFDVASTPFECIDWVHHGAKLVIDGDSFPVFPSPYSLGCQVNAPMVVVSQVSELETLEVGGKILLLRGEIAKEQLMPKNFPFFNPEEHQRIIQLLEIKQPSAIITATSMDLDMVGAIYPFPLFEDGDFDIPSVFTTDLVGERLAEYVNKNCWLKSQAERIPGLGYQVVGRKFPDADQKVTIFAHIDTRLGTPGANDNASGVVTLLLLAELLADYRGGLGIEIVAMNGEDYYAATGEKLWIMDNERKYDRIILGINLDDVGYLKGRISYSLYGCSNELEAKINDTFSGHDQLIQGESWYQGDHGLFLINQVPALAFTAELMREMMREITHTPEDTIELVDPLKLTSLARSINDLIHGLEYLT